MRYLFVTGKLAEPALRRLLGDLAGKLGFEFDIAVMPITVVSLASVSWIARHLHVTGTFDRIVLPGLCAGDPEEIAKLTGAPVQRGPQDLRDLAEFFGTKHDRPYGGHSIEILAEINHAPRLEREVIRAQARSFRDSGADVIDLGCDPGTTWSGVGDAVRALRDEGLRVSIDSFDLREVADAVKAGAELVLSVHAANRKAACDWGCEVVAMPDVPGTLDGLDETMEFLRSRGVPFRADPIIEPIGFGFAASLGRYLEVRRRHPDIPMLMGVGNLTELTDVDSAGVNVMLLGFCEELGIRSVLTTEVIAWCRGCVRELDRARRLVHHAVQENVLPKHREPSLVQLRDPKLLEHGDHVLNELASKIKDPNFRIFAERGLLHVLNDKAYLTGTDPCELFRQMQEKQAIDSDHAFYLGQELEKAHTALLLGKNYVQDRPLRWGIAEGKE